MIKEFSDPLNCSVLLLVNLNVPKHENVLSFIDATLECSLSLSYTFLLKRQLHYFAWYDVKQGGCRRIRVEREKELYEAVDGLLQALPNEETTDTLTVYQAEHPNEQYTDLYYVTGEISEADLDILSIIKAQAKQLIYLNEEENPANHGGIPAVIQKKFNEMGIHLWSVELTDIKNDMEQIRLG
jgi:hypothetical protein